MKTGDKNKVAVYIDKDVYTAAKERIRECINIFDNIIVSFSGGKDSLAVLELVSEIYQELGIKEKINVVFRDEELIPNVVVDFVKKYYDDERFKMLWLAIPMESNKYVLGKTFRYVQWDENRKGNYVREKPEWSIKEIDGNKQVFSQYSLDGYIGSLFKGSVCIMTGIRADESLMRLAGITQCFNTPYLSNSSADGVMLGKPIYDWTEDDVFKYFYDNGIQYNSIYDNLYVNGSDLRVSTPIHSEAAKKIDKLKTLDPEFYDRLTRVFPEMLVQDRYYKDYDKNSVYKKYEMSYKGIREYILNEIDDPKMKKLALKRVSDAWKSRQNRIQKGYPAGNNDYGFSPEYVFKQVVSGNIKRQILPEMKK